MKKLNEAEKATFIYCTCMAIMMTLCKIFGSITDNWGIVIFIPIITALIIFSIQRGIRNYIEQKDAKIKAWKEYQEFLKKT